MRRRNLQRRSDRTALSIITLFLVILSITEMTRQDKSTLSGLGSRVASTLSTVALFSLGANRRERVSELNRSEQLGVDVPTTSLSAVGTGTKTTMSSTQQYYSIRVIDADTGRGVPLVYLRSQYRSIWVTDSAGYIAFFEPELMTGEGVWMNVASYGYETPQGGFGTEGLQVFPIAGGSIELRLKRTQVAQRLYRMTGYGIYRDSVLLGQQTPLQHPMINAKVAGSDTVQCAKYHGELFWMWQDTDQIAWPLGNFNMTGATTLMPDKLDPEQGFDFKYLTSGNDDDPNAFARSLAKVQLDVPGSFPVWVDGLTVVPDEKGHERLVGRYYASGKHMECMEEGLVQWNDTTQSLEKIMKLPSCGGLAPQGHTYYIKDNGVRYAYYGKNVRVIADLAHASDVSQYEAFTCLSKDGKTVRRDSSGQLLWGWVKGGKPVSYETSNNLVTQGLIRAEESTYRLVDIDTGRRFNAAQVAIAWNSYLNLWVNIIQEHMGDTTAGEIWFSTARSPEGPWTNAKKVATHYMNNQSYKNNSNDLYNPVQHYELQGPEHGDGRYVYFSGTFVNTFSGNMWSTPLYNYNNLMYRLDVNETALQLPSPPPGLWNSKPDAW